MADNGRINKELIECQRDTDSNINVVVVDDVPGKRHLEGTIHGPDSTPYDGGVFTVDIVIPAEYPFEPPKMKFLTKIYHPNVSSQTGAICLDILKDQWSPALTIKTALLSLQALLCAPEPSDPQDAEVAKVYMQDADHATFNRTAKCVVSPCCCSRWCESDSRPLSLPSRFWTDTYAVPRKEADAGNEAAVDNLVAMGFDRDASREALAASGWDESQAVNALCGG
jgi:ubiquitin-conjugating enzyme (huntingtin interacting protein 2)